MSSLSGGRIQRERERQQEETAGRGHSNMYNRKTILVPSDVPGDDVRALLSLDASVLKRSLFIATFSLTEAPLHDRQKALRAVAGFAVLLIRFTGHYNGVNNTEYISALRDELSETGYLTCLFGYTLMSGADESSSHSAAGPGAGTAGRSPDHFTFVAMKRDMAPRGLFCDPSHPNFVFMISRGG
jgi:hypothetical protein